MLTTVEVTTARVTNPGSDSNSVAIIVAITAVGIAASTTNVPRVIPSRPSAVHTNHEIPGPTSSRIAFTATASRK